MLAVADKVVAEWTHDVQDTDLHIRTIKDVTIHEGDKVELRGEPFGKPGKFIKMAVSSRTALRARPHERGAAAARTGLGEGHAGGRARRGHRVQYTVDAGKTMLDVWATGPGLESSCGAYKVIQGSQIKGTQRIVLSPELRLVQGEEVAVVVTVLQPRKGEARGRQRIEATPDAVDRSVAIHIADPAGTWDAKLSLEDGRVRVEEKGQQPFR